MDEKYFNKKIDSILDCFTLWLLNEYCITDAEKDKAKAILQQIAADAFAAGAEAQKVASVEAANNICTSTRSTGTSSFIEDFIKRWEVVAAIESATVKWEVPGE